MFTTLLGVAVAVCVLAYLGGPALLRRVGILAKAEVNRAGEAVANIDPAGQLKALVANGTEQIRHAKDCLESENTLVRQAQRRLDQDCAEETRLTNLLQAAMANNDPNHTATNYAASLDHVRQAKAAHQKQLDDSKGRYAMYAKQVKLGQQTVEDARTKAESLQVELDESKQEAALTKFAQGFDVGNLASDLGDAVNRIQKQIDQNRSVGDVDRDLHAGQMAEAADADLAADTRTQAILDEFRQKSGRAPVAAGQS